MSVADPGKQIASMLLKKIQDSIYEHAMQPLENTEENRKRIAEAVEDHIRKYGKTADVDARMVDGYSVAHTKRGAKVVLMSEGESLETHWARSGRIANLIGKYHKNNTVIATFTIMPFSAAREVNVSNTNMTHQPT